MILDVSHADTSLTICQAQTSGITREVALYRAWKCLFAFLLKKKIYPSSLNKLNKKQLELGEFYFFRSMKTCDHFSVIFKISVSLNNIKQIKKILVPRKAVVSAAWQNVLIIKRIYSPF